MEPDLRNYPRSVKLNGLLLTLTRETRWTREFSDQRQERTLIFSRIEDGSAAVTLPDLQTDFAGWTEEQKCDFARAVEAGEFPQRGEFMRFLLRTTDARVHAIIAPYVTESLEPEEAFHLLSRACATAPAGGKANLLRAIGATGAAGAISFLQREHELLWQHPEVGTDHGGQNDIAADCISSLAGLLNLRSPPADAEAKMRLFRHHPAAAVRERARQVF